MFESFLLFTNFQDNKLVPYEGGQLFGRGHSIFIPSAVATEGCVPTLSRAKTQPLFGVNFQEKWYSTFLEFPKLAGDVQGQVVPRTRYWPIIF